MLYSLAQTNGLGGFWMTYNPAVMNSVLVIRMIHRDQPDVLGTQNEKQCAVNFTLETDVTSAK